MYVSAAAVIKTNKAGDVDASGGDVQPPAPQCLSCVVPKVSSLIVTRGRYWLCVLAHDSALLTHSGSRGKAAVSVTA